MICSFHSKFPTQNPPRPTQKNPFHVQIKYDTTCNFTFCRRLADEGDSKSLVLITRVGSTPTTGIKKRTSPACLGEFPLLSAAGERVEQHGPALQGERSALRAVAQCAGDPHHRHKKEKELLHKDKTCAAAPFFYCLQLYLCLCSRCSICSAGITSLRSTSLPQAHHSETAFCSFSTPACVRRLRSSAPTMQDTTILPRSSAMKG